MEVAVSKKTGEVTCADGVKYSPAEIDVYERTGGIITLAEHRVKKIIGGEIVEYKRAGADKPAVESGGAGVHNPESPPGKVGGAAEHGKANEGDELEIY
jgi:hypothetical protein